MGDGDDEEYRLLADHIIELTNPPDKDESEVSILMDAVTALHKVVAAMPCWCPAKMMGDNLCTTDACLRCQALGRFADREVSR